MSARVDALRLLDEFDAEVYNASSGDTLYLDIWLDGRTWVATDTHSLVVNYHTDRAAGWRALLDDLRKGVEPCDGCEGCQR